MANTRADVKLGAVIDYRFVRLNTHFWNRVPNHGMGRPILALNAQSWNRTLNSRIERPILELDAQSWNRTPNPGIERSKPGRLLIRYRLTEVSHSRREMPAA